MPGPPSATETQYTIRQVQKRFAAYYRHNRPVFPPDFEQREFGFMPFAVPPRMVRHQAFSRPKDLLAYFSRDPPWHAYHSTALYDDPGARTMEEKGWRGADLIFDLDADHLRGAEGLNHEDMLALCKKEFKTLLHDYILGDFGVKPTDCQVVFSGARGYHLHVREPGLRAFDSSARRELIDYIVGTGLQDTFVFDRDDLKVTEYRGRVTGVKSTYRPRAPDDPGWQGRFARGMVPLLSAWRVIYLAKKKDLIDEWVATGELKEAKARSIAKRLFEEGGYEKFEKDGIFDVFKGPDQLQAFVKICSARLGVSMSGQTDEPVTADVKRLIRLPGSLHGKTGLRVVPLEIGDLDEFDPLQDACVLDSKPMKVVCGKAQDFRVGPEKFSVKEGENEVPEYAAIYLIGQRNGVVSLPS